MEGDRYSNDPSDKFGSARQRVIVLTFETSDAADAWDDLDTAQAIESLKNPHQVVGLTIGRKS